MSSSSPVAITIGDPAGVGPETIVAGWNALDEATRRRCFVIGRARVLETACSVTGCDIRVDRIDSIQPPFDPAALPCLEIGDRECDTVPPGQLSAIAGQAAWLAIVTAAQLAVDGRIAAMVTAPIHKQAIRIAGHDFPGHTELLADLCGVDQVRMMLFLQKKYVPASPVGLGVAHATLHEPLRDAIARLDQKLIAETIRLISEFFSRLIQTDGLDRQPRIAVAALNPHGGEAGLFGNEEAEIIGPAVESARTSGLEATGPLPCDTLMARAVRGEFDGVVAMYHDQGHIAFKLLDMHRAVNVTLGLPIIRTSAAHGTAFDIAGTGKADCGGLVEATRLAVRLADSKTGRQNAECEPCADSDPQ